MCWSRRPGHDCVELFADLPAYLIGVQCPLGVLEESERSRKNRTFGQAQLQFPVIHKYAYMTRKWMHRSEPRRMRPHIK